MVEQKQSVGETPNERLVKLQSKLSESESGLARQTKECQTLKEDVARVEKATKDIDAVVKKYEGALKGLKEGKQTSYDYLKREQKVIECGLGDKKEKVTDKIASLNAEIDDGEGGGKENEVKELAKKKEQARSEYDSAKSMLESKDGAFKNSISGPDNWTKSIQEAKQLQTEIDKADQQKLYATMYVLAGELQEKLTKAELPEAADFQEDVYTAWDELEEATTAVREKAAALTEATTSLGKGEGELADLKKNLRQRILAAMGELDK